MLDWLKRKSIDKQQSNIAITLGKLLPICQELDRQIELNGGAVTDGVAFEMLQKCRRELFSDFYGPMEVEEIRSFIEAFLSAPGVPRSVGLAAGSALDEFEQDARR